jgi:hypothetical protein
MLPTFVVSLREDVEAAIIAGFLRQEGRVPERRRPRERGAARSASPPRASSE